MKFRIAAIVLLALAYGGARALPLVRPRDPVPTGVSPFTNLAGLSSSITAQDKAALRDAYDVLGRAIAADPDADPVFVDTQAVRRAHRAALLFVWRGVLSNQAGEVPGLREALEAALDSRIGSSDIPMNPVLRAEAAKCFHDIAKSLP